MTFNSFAFLGFFAAVMLLYFILPSKSRTILVFVSSLTFYALYNVKVTVFLCIYIILVYAFGILAERSKSKAIFALMIVAGLLPLLISKYVNFGLSIIDSVISRITASDAGHSINIIVPLGISYFTFKSIGYIADVYKGKISAERNFITFCAYISFFREMLAGPIDRSDNLLLQLKEKDTKSFYNLERGVLLLVWGYFEKMCVADRLGECVDTVYGDLYAYSGVAVIVSIAFYSLQIYLDFAGCTHMAMGVAYAMGFKLPQNFSQPYLAVSVQNFWKRWHMSLMGWFKEYVYIPMGGNRKGTIRKYINMMVVFALSGLWHGAGLSFILWGCLNGLLQICGMIADPVKEKVYRLFNADTSSDAIKWFKRIGTFILMSCTWVFFRADSVKHALLIFKRAFTGLSLYSLTDGTLYSIGLNEKNMHLLAFFLLIILIYDILREKGIRPFEKILGSHWIFKCIVFLTVLFTVMIFGIYGTAFDASKFIYMQF